MGNALNVPGRQVGLCQLVHSACIIEHRIIFGFATSEAPTDGFHGPDSNIEDAENAHEHTNINAIQTIATSVLFHAISWPLDLHRKDNMAFNFSLFQSAVTHVILDPRLKTPPRLKSPSLSFLQSSSSLHRKLRIF